MNVTLRIFLHLATVDMIHGYQTNRMPIIMKPLSNEAVVHVMFMLMLISLLFSLVLHAIHAFNNISVAHILKR